MLRKPKALSNIDDGNHPSSNVDHAQDNFRSGGQRDHFHGTNYTLHHRNMKRIFLALNDKNEELILHRESVHANPDQNYI